MLKRLAVTGVAAAVLAGGGIAVAQTAQRFSDVPADHEAFGAIEWAADVGLTAGFEDGTFRPSQSLTRWQAVTFMERFFDQILGADGAGGFTSDGFTRADMMVLLKTINDAAPPSTTTTVPPTTTVAASEVWIPFPEDRTAEGRCAPAIVMGVYDWEFCAWAGAEDPEMSRSEMRTLVGKVWAEMRSRGKPDNPPTLEEGYCGSTVPEDVLGCYLPSSHTIRLSTGFTLSTLLHELAHALISEHESLAGCGDDWTHRQPQCNHGEWYRCAADALYVRYGGLEWAGVCGTPPDLDPGDWFLGEPFETEWGDIHAIATVGDEDHLGYWLHLRCVTHYDHGSNPYADLLIGLPREIDIDDDTVEITHRFSDERPVTTQWRISTEGGDVVWPDWSADGMDAFADRIESGGTLYLSVPYGTRDTGRASFDLGDSPAVAIVLQACE